MAESRSDLKADARQGLKLTAPTGSEDEKAQLQKLYDNLRRQLQVPRTERLSGRSLAEWDDKKQAVCVLRKDGKFGSFGYSQEGKHYLEYFEAMFLLELGRLQLEYHSMVMSIEQAHLLFLGEKASPRYNRYLVYSNLSRVGYIVVSHKNLSYQEREEVTQTDCAWEIALSEINQTPVPGYIKKSPFYAKAKQSMDEIKVSIKTQEHKEANADGSAMASKIDFSVKLKAGRKRAADNSEKSGAPEAKRRYVPSYAENKSYVDFLMQDPEYKRFQHMFEKVDLIRLKERISIDDDTLRIFHIDFDLHLHSENFKKSTPKPPAFRLIIVGENENFPTNAEISNCYRQQKFAVPLLIISISESKQMQAFLYFF